MRVLAKKVFPEESLLGKLLRKGYALLWQLLHRYYIYRYNKVLIPLMSDMNLLSEKIRLIKEPQSRATMKFYIIRNKATLIPVGLFNHVITTFMHILYATAKGMIPVIDMQNYPNIYLDDEKFGFENAWEYYFKQPCNFGLDDANTVSRLHVVYSSQHNVFQQVLPLLLYGNEKHYERDFRIWVTMFKHFFCLSSDALKYVDEEFCKIIKPGIRVIGIICRGGDYTAMRPKGHAVQPKVEDVIRKVKSVISDWSCDYIYVSSDERKAVKAFEEAFPGRVLSLSRMYYDDIGFDYSKQYIGEAKFNRENDAYLKGLEYLTQIMILSRCTSAVLSMTAGSAAARYINGGKYENLYVFDLGIY